MNIMLSRIYLVFCLFLASSHLFASTEKFIESLEQIGTKGAGNEKAVANWNELSTMSSSSIPRLLDSMNRANDLGDNWIRSAIQEILAKSGLPSLPKDEVVQFIRNPQNDGSSRRAAYEFLSESHPQIAQSLIASFIDDTEPTLRREGVSLLLKEAGQINNKEQSIEAFEYALGKARDVDQIEEASESLKNLGKIIQLQELMGFITNWQVIGPFDNTDREGFGKIYSPERDNGLLGKHTGENGPITWKPCTTEDSLGLVDLNQPFGYLKEVLCYARTEFESDSDRAVQFRIGSKNAWKLWVNNELVFARDEYHRGMTRVDQFILDGRLKSGTNLILVKVCQNEQEESWTKQWEFSMRITDPSGEPIKP